MAENKFKKKENWEEIKSVMTKLFCISPFPPGLMLPQVQFLLEGNWDTNRFYINFRNSLKILAKNPLITQYHIDNEGIELNRLKCYLFVLCDEKWIQIDKKDFFLDSYRNFKLNSVSDNYNTKKAVNYTKQQEDLEKFVIKKDEEKIKDNMLILEDEINRKLKNEGNLEKVVIDWLLNKGHKKIEYRIDKFYDAEMKKYLEYEELEWLLETMRSTQKENNEE